MDLEDNNIDVHKKENRGVYVWKVNLKPGKEKELVYKFRISYSLNKVRDQEA